MCYVEIPAVVVVLANVNRYDVTGLKRRSRQFGWKANELNGRRSPFEGDEQGSVEMIAEVCYKRTFSVTDVREVLKDIDGIFIDTQAPTDAQNMSRYEFLRGAYNYSLLAKETESS